MSTSPQLKPDWKKHWRLARSAPVSTLTQKDKTKGKKISRPTTVRRNTPELNFTALPVELGKVLDEFCQSGSPTLATDRRYRIALACYEYLTGFYELSDIGNQRTVTGLPLSLRAGKKLKADWLQTVFEQVVGRAEREEELGLRQRANYLKLFEELREKLQPCFPGMRLEAAHNYSRTIRHLPVSPEVNLSVPPHYRERIMAVLEAAILAPPELEVGPDSKAGVKQTEEVWRKAHAERFARFALLLMLGLGVTFRGVIGAICRIELQDVRLDQGFVVLYHRPDRRTWLPVWLDDLTAIALSSLIIHASRRQDNIRKRTIQPQEAHTLLSTWQVLPPATSNRIATGTQEESEEEEDETEDYSFEEALEEDYDEESFPAVRDSKVTPGSANRVDIELRRAKRQLDDCFKVVCEQAGLETPVTLVQMLHSTRWVLNEQAAFGPSKTGAVVALLSGFIKSGFFQEEMVQPDWSVSIPDWFRKLVKTEKQATTNSCTAETDAVTTRRSYSRRVGQYHQRNRKESVAPLESSQKIKQNQELEQANQLLRKAMQGLDDHRHTGLDRSLTRRQEDRRQRHEAGLALRHLAATWLGVTEVPPDQKKPSISHRVLAERLRYFHSSGVDAGVIPTYPLNLVTLALWLAWELEEATPPKRSETMSSYRSEGIYLLKALPEKLFADYDWEDVEEVLELDLAEEPPIRRKAVLKDLRSSLSRCGVALSPLDLENDRFKNTSRTTREQILVPAQLWKIAAGLNPAMPGKDRSLLLTLLLGYFLMLRDGEICRLEWADFELESPQPFVRIVNTKRHKSRNVPLENIPAEIIELLKCWKQQQAREEGSGQLILSEKYQPLSPSRLSALVKEQLRKGGYPEVSLHDLRKSGANWRYYSSLDLPATAVGRQLGHSGLMVTFKCYLKGLDLIQREAALRLVPSITAASDVEVDGSQEWTMPVAKLALLANLSSRQQAYNLVGGRKLTLKLVRKILVGQLARS